MAVPTLTRLNQMNFGQHLNQLDLWIKMYPVRRLRLAMALLAWMETFYPKHVCNRNGVNSDVCDACRGERAADELPM